MVKLFLKKPEESQGLVQKVLQAATAENDNPDIRDRAYVYWRLLSSDPQVAKNVVLSSRPPITSTIPVLPGPLLDALLPNLCTLSSVYQKLPAAFLGQGRGSALQAAAIEEARQEARDNPIAAAAVTAAISGAASSQPMQNNAENLLDIDFDGAAPASMQKTPAMGSTGLEGLAGTPQRVDSPLPTSPATAASASMGGLDDLMGAFGNGTKAPSVMDNDLVDGLGSLGLNGSQPPPPQTQLKQASQGNQDLLDLI